MSQDSYSSNLSSASSSIILSNDEITQLFGSNAGYVQELYSLFLTDPTLVGDEWQEIFSDLSNGKSISIHGLDSADELIRNKATRFESNGNGVHYNSNGYHDTSTNKVSDSSLDLNERAFRLVRAFRERGHLRAAVNPVSNCRIPSISDRELQIESYGFSDQELESEVLCDRLLGQRQMRLSEVISALELSYCGSVGVEYLHLTTKEARDFIQERVESRLQSTAAKSQDYKRRILSKIVDAEVMESELHKKYVGQKRFSLQGGETLISLIDSIINESPENGVREVVLGMPHRGRLNVLVNTVGKPLSVLFDEFEDQAPQSVLGSGDVKYHLGYSSIQKTLNGEVVNISLAPNPSHLEFVNPVVAGIARARQDIAFNHDRNAVMPILLHGDASFIGQGVVPETLNLVSLAGYSNGGTIHIVVNNQVGFTTDPIEARSTNYCTDIAKGFDAPIFHVNAEDPEAVSWIAELAVKFRAKFAKDVVIDLQCYRKYGHNEGDDPSFTQPALYQEINKKKPISAIFAERLIKDGSLSEQEYQGIVSSAISAFATAANQRAPINLGEACAVHGRLQSSPQLTSVHAERLEQVTKAMITPTPDFQPHPKIGKLLEKRLEAITSGEGIDWGFAEMLAFGTLLFEGVTVRVSGQDCGRGTFSQRHAVLSSSDGTKQMPISQLEKFGNGAHIEIINSSLSETGVLGYEFGYSATNDKALVCWEAQFGDFANGGQVIIDQFIAASEAKWGQRSGVVLLLPHGMEGQGPEHSSARLERFLQLCAEGNMTVCYPTTAAQHFHMLRRHGLSNIKRPLVVMTPKSLLRLPAATSKRAELTEGTFRPVLVDKFIKKGSKAPVVCCSGKVYYDIANELDKRSERSVKVLRIEQLYPFPERALIEVLSDDITGDIIWVQEEPKNMGAWSYVEPVLRRLTKNEIIYCGRQESASPATGSGKHSAKELRGFLDQLVSLVNKG